MAAEKIFDAEVKRDDDSIALKRDVGKGPPPFFDEPPFDPGGNGRGGGARAPVGNAYLAMLLFIGADVMFFAGLIGAFVVFRFGAVNWPPLGQPRLPVVVTGVNTIILLASGYTMFCAWRHLQDWKRPGIANCLTITTVLGSIFLLVQGYEWTKLIGFGLTIQSSVYGAIFYTLIGCHALHVFGAVIWLLAVLLMFKRNRFSAKKHVGIKLAGMYWFLVVGLWPVLYALVYLK
ncbi:heme-copper oxidase subunit III [candidate division KSB1 bacterium]|nr:heme-copper oxidase subunit III [candidate division KSB1 bacterium]